MLNHVQGEATFACLVKRSDQRTRQSDPARGKDKGLPGLGCRAPLRPETKSDPAPGIEERTADRHSQTEAADDKHEDWLGPVAVVENCSARHLVGHTPAEPRGGEAEPRLEMLERAAHTHDGPSRGSQ